MPPIDQQSLMAIQPELAAGETVLWAGRPKTSIILHREDTFLIPFSLLWGGFAIFWELSVAGYWGSKTPNTAPSAFMMLWGIPFIVMGQYMIWGRFLYALWKKTGTHYVVTDRRVIVVQDGWKRQTVSAFIDTLPTLTKEGRPGQFGTLRFTQSIPLWSNNRGWGMWDGMNMGHVPVFIDIEDVDSVYHLVSDLREKARKRQGADEGVLGNDR